jgi:hypothetical protein
MDEWVDKVAEASTAGGLGAGDGPEALHGLPAGRGRPPPAGV